MIGVYKAYTTRVGEGPFPTELDGPEADVLRQLGTPWAEIGTTTGRLRRVGWFDGVMARYAAQINGIDTVAITKLDVLDGVQTIKICTAYKLHDATLEYPPATTAVFEQVEPVYEEMPGWMTPTTAIRRFQDLPEAAQAYVARICQIVGARLGIISVGPDRDQTIMAGEVF